MELVAGAIVLHNCMRYVSKKREQFQQHTHFNLTGFGKFHGVADNPTMRLMHSLPNVLQERPLPPHINVGSMTVLEVSGEGCMEQFRELRCKLPSSSGGNTHTIWVHFGVSGQAKTFLLESQAFNDASFRVADERKWQPHQEQIVKEDKWNHVEPTDIPVDKAVRRLQALGHSVERSDSAGRFVCNYIFYQSLKHSKQAHRSSSLFVHVPPHAVLSEEKLNAFARDALQVIAECMREP